MPTLLQAENLSLSFGERILFENVSFSINQYQKIALIARNGLGKTSLLNILAGLAAPDRGTVQFFNDATIAYLKQEPELDETKTVFDEVYASSNETFRAIRNYETAIQSNNKALLQQATERMDALKAWEYENRICQVLTRLDLTDLNQPVAQLSGGQRKRVALAKILCGKPDFMILDEPTNHLDIEMIEWLEEHLSRNNITVLMVTHDRYFLERVCEEILELDDRRLFRYKGNYSFFIEKQQERRDNETQEREKARNLLRREQEWISRMPKARTTKSKARISGYYELKERAENRPQDQQISLTMEGSRVGKKILEIHDVSFSWNDEKPLLEHFGHIFKRKEKAGIIGRNGSGKSTLLDIITGKIRPGKGTIEPGATIQFGYYQQNGIEFDETTRVIDVVKRIADVVKMSNGEKVTAAHFLNYFMFPYPTHQQLVYTLSGGEKRRLYLVTVLMQNPNFLILDEPTNDLDIITLNILEEYLISFQGCVLVVSHDRYFLDKIAEHLFVFKGNGVVRDFPGNYSQFNEDQEKRKKRTDQSFHEKVEKVRPAKQSPKSGLSYKERKQMEDLEQQIALLESEKAGLEECLASGDQSQQYLVIQSKRFAAILVEIESATLRWMELAEKNEKNV